MTRTLVEIQATQAPAQRQARALLREWLSSDAVPNPLPSEHQIARNLGVAQPTVHRALIMLEKEGLVIREGRLRRPTSALLAPSEHILNSSIVVITPYRNSENPNHSDTWIDGSTRGVYDMIARGDLNALILKPESFHEHTAQQLINSKPTGVVVPEIYKSTREEIQTLIAPFIEGKIPVAVYSGAFESPEADQVVSDHEEGGFLLTRWLIEHGRRRIYRQESTQNTELRWVRERKKGYERAMREAGLELQPTLVIPIIPDADDGSEQTNETRAHLWTGYLYPHKQQIDAVLLESDAQVPVLSRALRILGLVPNQDVAMVGYDNYWSELMECQFEPTPPLATIDKLNRMAGRELIQLILDRSAGKLPPEPVMRTIKPKLVVTSETASAS